MGPPFSSPVVVSADPDLVDVQGLFEANRAALEREIGTSFSFGVREPNIPSTWTLRLGASAPRLVFDREAQTLICEAPDRSSFFDTLSLLWDLHGHPGGTIPVQDCATVTEAVDRIEEAIRRSWPSFDLHNIDWTALTEQYRSKILTAEDPVPELKSWLACLGDCHTTIRPVEQPGRLPYRAVAQNDQVVLTEVPEGSTGHLAGARVGHALRGIDVARLRRESGGRPHSLPHLIGLTALRGPVGQEVQLETESGARWTESYQRNPWPQIVEGRRLRDDVGYLRLRAWSTEYEQHLNEAMEALADCPSLLFDLRGNGGGNFLMACRFRGRFLQKDRQVGWIRYRLPGGGMSVREPIHAQAAEPALRWEKPLTIWTDPKTYSASEDFLMGLSEEPQIRILGEPSGGGSGRLRVLRLMEGWRLTITTSHTFTNDGHCIEGAGHPVEGPIPTQ